MRNWSLRIRSKKHPRSSYRLEFYLPGRPKLDQKVSQHMELRQSNKAFEDVATTIKFIYGDPTMFHNEVERTLADQLRHRTR